jgi:hypothetical protein
MKGNWDQVSVDDTEGSVGGRDEPQKCDALREFIFLRWGLKMKGGEKGDDEGKYEL